MSMSPKQGAVILFLFCPLAWAKDTKLADMPVPSLPSAHVLPHNALLNNTPVANPLSVADIEQKLASLQATRADKLPTFRVFDGLDEPTLKSTSVARLADNAQAFGQNTPNDSDTALLNNTDDNAVLLADGLFTNDVFNYTSDGIMPDGTTPNHTANDTAKTPKRATPNVIKRLYNRLFNDGVEGLARLNATIYLQERQLDDVASQLSADDMLATSTDQLTSGLWQKNNRQQKEQPKTPNHKTRIKADHSKQPFRNIKAALDNITIDSMGASAIAMPRLTQTINAAARAVGYYDMEFELVDKGAGKIDVIIHTLGKPVLVNSYGIDIRHQGDTLPVIQEILANAPKRGDIFYHGEYETTKADIDQLSNEYGFFDGRWLNHAVDVILPDNTADVSLVYDTGERYVFDDVVFFTVDDKGNYTTDPNQLPVQPALLQKLLNFQKGDGYQANQVAKLANQINATRYFDNTNIEVVYPKKSTNSPNAQTDTPAASLADVETVELDDDTLATISPIDFSPSKDILTKLDQVSNKASELLNLPSNQLVAYQHKNSSILGRLSQLVSNIAKFVLPDESKDTHTLNVANAGEFLHKKQADTVYQDKKIPLYVFVASDKPRQAQIGLGYGSDTGWRATTKFEHNLINKDGYQAGVDLAYSALEKQAVAHVSRPLSHPINDTLTTNLKYQQKNIKQSADSFGLSSRTLEAGVYRTLLNENSWNYTYSLRYKLDKLDSHADPATWQNLPVRFLDKPIQKALLAGISINKQSGDTLNPLQGYQQNYTLELGARSALSDANMAILRAGVGGVYSFGNNLYGQNRAHQLVGRLNFGYLWSDDFENVPYKLRFFTGGDQSIRGYDHESLSPVNALGYRTGGQSLAVGSVEYNYELKDGLRVATFADVGGAYQKNFAGKTHVGAGIGVRYASPVGTVRVDLATPIGEPKTSVKLHFLIGLPF